MKIHTIQVHIGDLVGGTIHMDNAEFGAYWALVLCCYQSKDHTLPNDDARLARMAKCTPREWQKVKAIVLEKFIVSGSELRQKRVDEDVVLYQEKSQRNRANALKRHNSPLPVASQSHSQTPAIQDPRPKTHNPKDNTNVLSTPISPAFDQAWSIYPKQRIGNKQAAERAWANALKRQHTENQILQGVINYGQSDEVARGFAKGFAAWLNDDRFLNDYSTQVQAGTDKRRNSGFDAFRSVAGKIQDHGRPEMAPDPALPGPRTVGTLPGRKDNLLGTDDDANPF